MVKSKSSMECESSRKENSLGLSPLIVAAAKTALCKNIARRRKRGQQVKILKEPYHEGLNTIRCVLMLDGERNRFFYCPAKDRWIKAS